MTIVMRNPSVAAEARSASSPKIERFVTPKGLEVWLAPSFAAPMLALEFAFKGGSAQDPVGKTGLAYLMAGLLDEGAGPHDAQAFQDLLAAKAIDLRFHTTHDEIKGSLKTLVKHAAKAFDLLRLALQAPRFDETAIARVKDQVLTQIRYAANDPGSMASKGFMAKAYPNHPYGRPSEGTEEDLGAIARSDLVESHGRLLAKDNLVIVAAGAILPEALAILIDQAFVDLPETTKVSPVPFAKVAGLGERTVLDLDVPQTVIRFGAQGLLRTDPDYLPAYVFNHVLGGGSFTSRLFQEVREKRGLAYSVGTSLVPMHASGLFAGFTATKNERVNEALEVIAQETHKLLSQGFEDDEFLKAKSYLIGSYALTFDTSTKIAGYLRDLILDGLDVDYIERRNRLIEAVTPEMALKAGQGILGDGKMVMVMAGRPVQG